jgi:hypothetical protein
LLNFLNFFKNPELTKEGHEVMHLNKVDQETEISDQGIEAMREREREREICSRIAQS